MVKVGFIGCGGNARGHMERVSKMEDVKIVALCDIVEAKANECSQKYGGNIYTDCHKMFDEEKLDAVYISLIPSAHDDQEILAASKKIHFYVEKPVALSMKKAREVNEAIKNAGIITSVGYQLRYLDSINKAKEFLKDKSPALMHGTYACPFVPTPWWRVMKHSGGQVVEQSTHLYDLTRYLLGDIDRVYALGYRGLLTDVKDNDIDDGSSANLHFKNGIAGNITTTCLLKSGWKFELDIILKHMSVYVSGGGIFRIVNGGKEEIKATNNPSIEADRTFIEAVKNGDPSKILSDYEDGMKTLEVTLAVNESIKTGKIIHLE